MQAIIPEVKFPQPDPCWLQAPVERSPQFLPVFARISIALQTTLRERVPAAYFDNLDAFQDVIRAYPMLIYQASRPFRARVRTDLTYDVLNPGLLTRLIRNARPGLTDLLAHTETKLREAGCDQVADQYRAKRAAHIIDDVQRLSKSRKCLFVLIRAESVLMNALIELGGLERLKPKEQTRRIALFAKRWSFQLRRLYPGTDYLWLAPALMDAATQALLSCQNQQPEPEPAAAQPIDP
ncbi:MAG: hypothetical protein LAP38_13310 [Acidobacteriia bacterium]|nr:hypothetical protein [Terriglobia bacterium]